MFVKLKKKIFSKVQSVFANEIFQMTQAAVQADQKDRGDREKAVQHATYHEMIGKPVIAVGNDWSNPIIGIGLEVVLITQANQPHLVIHDYLTGQEFMPFGAVMYYDETRFEAIMKLNPFEVASLVYRLHTAESPVNVEQEGKRDSREVIIEKLTKNGFFDAIAPKE